MGRHAAIVRNNGQGLEYLELQSPDSLKNGWQPFEKDTLRKRFKCAVSQRTRNKQKIKSPVVAIEIETFQGSQEFEDILGYINIEELKQVKGSGGHVK